MLRKFVFVVLIASAANLTFVRPARAELHAAATTPDLASALKAVGGRAVTVFALTTSSQDPHFVMPTAGLAAPLRGVDLLAVNGLDLEAAWLPVLLATARNHQIQTGERGYLDCAEFVPRFESPLGPVERGLGSVHTEANPHYMSDPRRAIEVAHGMAARLGELDPPHAQYYRENAAEFAARLEDAMASWSRELAPHRGTRVITFHRSFLYLFDYLGWSGIATIEPRPGIPPHLDRLDDVAAAARQMNVRLVLLEPFYPREPAEYVARNGGARVVDFLSAVRFNSGETYLERFERNMAALRAAVQ